MPREKAVVFIEEDSAFLCSECAEFANEVVFKPYYDIVEKNLPPHLKAKWDAMSKVQKRDAVIRMVEEGVIKIKGFKNPYLEEE